MAGQCHNPHYVPGLVCHNSALGVTETWVMMKTAFSYPSSQRAGQRGQNYGLGINLLFFLTEISFFVVCVCARACLCVCVPMCVFVM